MPRYKHRKSLMTSMRMLDNNRMTIVSKDLSPLVCRHFTFLSLSSETISTMSISFQIGRTIRAEYLLKFAFFFSLSFSRYIYSSYYRFISISWVKKIVCDKSELNYKLIFYLLNEINEKSEWSFYKSCIIILGKKLFKLPFLKTLKN